MPSIHIVHPLNGKLSRFRGLFRVSPLTQRLCATFSPPAQDVWNGEAGRPEAGPRSNYLATAAILTLFAFIVYMIPTHSKEGIDAGGDTGAAELLPISLLRYHTLTFDNLVRDHALPDRDSAGPAAALPYYLTRVNGHIVSFYPIVPGLVNVPIFWLADRFGIDLFQRRYQLSSLTSALVCALSMGAMFLALGHVCLTRRRAVFFTLVFGFATTTWSVCSHTLWQHGPALFFLSVALALTLGRCPRGIAWSGFFLVLAVWTRPTVILIAAPIGIYIFVHQRHLFGTFLCTAIVPMALMAVYSHIYLGSVLSLGQGRNIIQDTTGPDATYGTGWTGLMGILFSPARGLLIFSPIFLVSFIFLFRSLLDRNVHRLYPYLAAGVILYIALYSQWKVWWGGYSFGYRLLTEIVPILVLFSAEGWQRWFVARPLRSSVFAALVTISVYVNFLGALYYPTNFNNVPISVNSRPDRLWNISDTELVRCQLSLLADLHRMFTAGSPETCNSRQLRPSS